MKHRWWIAALITAAVLGTASPSRALGIFHRGGKNQEQIVSCVNQRAWIAYFKSDKGVLAPVRDTQNTDNDKEWIGLRFTDYEGPRIRLGVLKVINKSAEAEENEGHGKIEVPVSGIQEMLTVALSSTKRFDVIEQKRFQEIETQQTRKDLLEPSPTSIAKVGKVLQAQYLVYGTVNEWTPDRASHGIREKIFKGGKNEAEVAITFTLTDVANGQILFTTAERARMAEWSFGFSGPEVGEGSTTEKTPVNYAIRACANKAALKIATFLRDRKWKGTVVDVKGPNVYVNAGSQQGMVSGLLLSAFTVKGIVKDVEGRMNLGEDLKGIGTLSVDSVQPGFSIAHAANGCKGIKKGDRVELASPPAPPPVPPNCKEMDQSLAP